MTSTLRKMVCKTIIVLIIGLTKCVSTIKVNLHGRITLGQEVMESISQYIEPSLVAGRRSMTSKHENDIAKLITSKELCNDIPMCSGPLGSFVDNYLIILTTAVDNIFKSSSFKDNFEKIFFEQLEKILRDVKKILKSVNNKISEAKEFYYWNKILKRISAKFHNLITLTVGNSFKGAEQNNETKIFVQKVITAIVVVESKYENKLCVEHKICIQSYECTKAVHRVLERLTNLPEVYVRSFVKSFYEALLASTFYSRLSDVTAREFQTILNDLALSNNVSVRELLLSVQKTVESRLDQIKNPENKQEGYDVLLINMILSDLDHFFSTHKEQPFRDFVKKFTDWTIDGRVGKHLRKVISEIGNEVSVQKDEISTKIENEVRVFLELTIDPE